ncbi:MULTISPECIES: response regulator transcription factor [Sphingobacterium]|jgi:two-component system, OmpR family, response regulator TrcR|uniref:Probable transcriptional regulatory protein TcrX n=4 Tax=Sphingobacterium TaxID=28453 RepID=A0A2X2LE61_SPHMU|nr:MULTISPECIES: response regulator transcription factor [Sphingobacterium]HAE69475.1 DNA-binding response regulator [Sphingobacterium sp.]MDF2851910.1 DNA-binding response regulator [Sphingobacterium multivorum]OFV20124.1 two-component system response regulator [Sphingobacterium sp. HMSC13C05]OJZ10752.1 MAG: two-component system response regulator [Sphingobacterium sp. 40-24]QQT43099.1 response regulator transcription factor [Sphingobacterium multivorum]
MIEILYVEDEPSLGMIVADSLEANGFNVTHCSNGHEALEAFTAARPDILVVDVMMPVMDGFTLATKIRESDTQIPIIFLTAKVQTEDVVKGFRLGGDDYVKKPFKIEELVVRIESLLKNSPKMLFGQKLMIGDYSLDSLKHQLTYQGEVLKLSFRESELLRKLYEQKDKVIPREDIMRAYWSHDKYFTGRSLDVFISRIRKYLSQDDRIKITNVRGVGYMLTVD